MSFSINGLISNLDTAKIVSDLMKIERIPYTTLETKKTNIQSEQTIFRNINTKLSALETAAKDLRYNADFNVFAAKSSNTNGLTVTTTDAAETGTYSLSVQKLAQANVKAMQGIDPSGTNLANLTSVSINNQSIDLADDLGIVSGESNESVLKKLANYVNSHSELGVTASMVKTNSNGQLAFTLTSKTTGAQSAIQTSGFGGAFSNIVAAQDAEFTFNGVPVKRATNTINDLISGASIQLLAEGQSSTITIQQDTDKIIGKIENFVKTYNELITLVKDNLSKPSDDKKMNPLQGDSVLKEISNSLYGMVNGLVGNEQGFKMMSDIGLTIDKGVTSPSLMTGKITFDKEVFKAKFSENAESVTGMFTNSSNGLMTELDKTIRSRWTSTVSGSINSKISGYDAELKVIDDRLISLDARLTMRETRLKSQFATMETMLSSLKNQQNWLTSQFESLTKANK
ncbi:flagellar filament capping protein FliD [Paenibacillus sp. PAMC21692]|uniref:flagellar filament capping protein FliD n=1 Tax=Paenibacillus sp. PAMC21692 TaxID=2762320 RepID=UPI00164D5998|nr:flagellar filament capping protein FliD [Paenibacillus sp. PAMC21692]QNK58360.1 flagellar filament capping protein FliD [Paenibacillus sp. PAMC21692]